MLNFILVGVFLFGYVCGEAMIGPGKWSIYHLSSQIGEVNDIVFDLHQTSLNRTHYVLNGKVKLLRPINEDLGMKIEVCKFVDGGCKQYAYMTDTSFCDLANRFAENNINECLATMGVVPPKLPLRQGDYEVKDFVFDVHELPAEFTYGHFKGEICAMNLYLGIPVGCLTAEYEFSKMRSDSESEEE